VIRWNPLLLRDVAEDSFLLVIIAAHSLVSFFLHSDGLRLPKVAAIREFHCYNLYSARCITFPLSVSYPVNAPSG
jgi:hypothetical protein